MKIVKIEKIKGGLSQVRSVSLSPVSDFDAPLTPPNPYPIVEEDNRPIMVKIRETLETQFKDLKSKLQTLDPDYIPKLLEDTFDCVTMCMEKVENTPRSLTILRAFRIYFRLRTGKSSLAIVKNVVMPRILDILDEMTTVQSDVIEDSLDKARNVFESAQNVSNSPVLVKLYKCAMYAMTFSLFDNIGAGFDNLGYTKLEQAVMKKKYYSRSGFTMSIIDTLLFVCERGYQVYKTKDIYTIFHSGKSYTKLYESVQTIKRQQYLLSNPEEHGFSESEFRSNLDDIIEKLTSVHKHSYRLDTFDQRNIRILLEEMLMLRDDINTKAAARRTRKAPFSVLLFGNSGIGKTTITEMLCILFAKLMDLPEGTEHRYTRNPAAKYWDGFVSSIHTIVLDDVANENPNLGDPSSVNEIIQLMNNAAFCPDQAALENKGRTPMLAKFVIGTTNVKDLNASAYFSCPSAVQRRFPYIITPTVKEEYLNKNGMLDSTKVKEDVAFPDLWTFRVEAVKPTPIEGRKHKLATLKVIGEDMNQIQFFAWFRDACREFEENQNRVRNCVNMMKEVDLCSCCKLPETMCPIKVQSLDISGKTFAACLTSLFLMFFNISLLSWFMFRVRKLDIYLRYRVLSQERLEEYDAKMRELYSSFQTAKYWADLGGRMQRRIGSHKILLSIVAFAGGSYGLYRLYRKATVQSGDEKYNITDVGVRPQAELNGRENVWYNNELSLSPADFTRESSSAKGMGFDDFCSMISQNVSVLQVFKNEDTSRVGRLLCLGGHVYITNNHGVPRIEDSLKATMTNCAHAEGVQSNVEITLTEDDLVRYPERDLVLVLIRNVPPRKDITKYLPAGPLEGIFNGRYVTRERTGEVNFHDVKNINHTGVRHFRVPSLDLDTGIDIWNGKCKYKTPNGFCGTPLILQSSYGYVIGGIHIALHDITPDLCLMTKFDGDFIREAFNKLGDFTVQSGNFALLASTNVKREIGPLHKKSVFRYLPQGNAHIYGSFVGFRGKSSTSVEHTPMSYHLAKEGYKIKFAKPEMKTWVPWHIGANDLANPISNIKSSRLNECARDYTMNVIDGIENDTIFEDQLLILDDFTAINGACVTYIDKMNRNTSAGNPWKKSKKYFIEAIPPMHDMQHPVKVSDEIMDRVLYIIEQYKTGTCVHPNFCAHLKDEPVSFKKARVGKTRVFTGAPFDWCIVVRKYLLSFCRVLQNERFAFESCPGTVAQSLEWEDLRNFLAHNGTSRIIAGDYKAFDKKMSPVEILKAFDVIVFFCRASGNYTEEDIRVVRCIAEDTAFALVDYNGDLVQFFGSNPSGNPLTVILNCIVNCLRMRYVYYELQPIDDDTPFFEGVRLLTYGDDLVASVAKGIPWFNHTTIAEKFNEMGIVFTMADKESESVPYITLDEATFLKRRWVKNDEIGCYFAPLEHESIEKMLMVWTRSKQIPPEFQGMEIIKTALREYFWYGREVFDEKKSMLKELVVRLNWGDWVEDSTFPTYDSLVQDFIKASRRSPSYKKYFSKNQDIHLVDPVERTEVSSSLVPRLQPSNSQA